jgi:hypothetical protein
MARFIEEMVPLVRLERTTTAGPRHHAARRKYRLQYVIERMVPTV